MKLSNLHTDGPPKTKRLKKLYKNVIHRPLTLPGGEMNKETHTPISVDSHFGAAPTGHHGSVR